MRVGVMGGMGGMGIMGEMGIMGNSSPLTTNSSLASPS